MNLPKEKRFKAVLLLVGVSLLAFAVYSTGLAEILRVGSRALPYLPLIVLANFGFFVCEGLGHRSMFGAQRHEITFKLFSRATLSAYVASVLLPLGRAGSEVFRTAAYRDATSLPRATAASATFQVPALFGNSVLGACCSLAAGLVLGFEAPLCWVLALHSLGGIAVGLAFALIAFRLGLGRFTSRFFPSLAASGQAFDAAAAIGPSTYMRATGYCVLARGMELLQYTVVLAAISVPLSFTTVALVNGVHLVGSTLGEAIPNQLGAVEGAYLYFADAIGLGADTARAVSIPLLVRLAQYVVAGLCLLTIRLWDSAAREAPLSAALPPPLPSEGAGVAPSLPAVAGALTPIPGCSAGEVDSSVASGDDRRGPHEG